MADVPGEMAAAFADADVAMHSVLDDGAVWVEEALNTEAEPLPWPLLPEGEDYEQLLRGFAAEAVQTVLHSMEKAHGAGFAPEQDADDPGFQIVLRVCARAVEAADAVLVAGYANVELSGKRNLENWLKKRELDQALNENGGHVEAAAKTVGMSTSAAYRALGRPLRGQGK